MSEPEKNVDQAGAISLLNGVRVLGVDYKINYEYLANKPNLDTIQNRIDLIEDQKGSANGIATLGDDGLIPSSQLPPMEYISKSQMGIAGGVASLGSDGKVPTDQLPSTVASSAHAAQHAAGGSDPISTESIDALNRSGDTMRGDLFLGDGFARLAATDFAAQIESRVGVGNINNRRLLVLKNQNGADIDKALSIVDYDGSGNVTPYDIYGEHNKPTPGDLGAFPFIDARTGIDMDDIIKSGIHFGAYRVGNSTGGTPYKYGKSSYAYGMIFSAGASTTSAMQIAFLSGSQYPFHRYFRDGKITEWFGLYTEGHLPTLEELGAAPAAEHKIKEYYTLEQIGITKGDTTAETIENIASKLPNYSMLMYFVGDGNNISEYPSGYGLIRAYKIQNTRTVFEFTSHMTNDFYYGICYEGSFKGWSQVYDTSNPPPVFSAGTKAPTNEKILWINTSNNTINYHTGSEWKSIGAVFG